MIYHEIIKTKKEVKFHEDLIQMNKDTELHLNLEGMLESTKLQVEELQEPKCAYLIHIGENPHTKKTTDYCHKAMYEHYFKCGYLKQGTKQCERYNK